MIIKKVNGDDVEIHTRSTRNDTLNGFELYVRWEDIKPIIEEYQREVHHWKSNHRCEVERARVLKERTDMPLERVKAYELLGEYQKMIYNEQVGCSDYSLMIKDS